MLGRIVRTGAKAVMAQSLKQATRAVVPKAFAVRGFSQLTKSDTLANLLSQELKHEEAEGAEVEEDYVSVKETILSKFELEQKDGEGKL